jgi:hypothetical protein
MPINSRAAIPFEQCPRAALLSVGQTAVSTGTFDLWPGSPAAVDHPVGADRRGAGRVQLDPELVDLLTERA